MHSRLTVPLPNSIRNRATNPPLVHQQPAVGQRHEEGDQVVLSGLTGASTRSASAQEKARLNRQVCEELIRLFPNRADFLREALENGADREGMTLLHWAAKSGNAESAQVLLENGATESINQADRVGMTPLHWAAFVGNVQLVQVLLENGVKPFINQADNEGRTPLHHAAKYGNVQLVQVLLENGATESINQADHEGETPLHCSYDSRQLDLARLLVRHWANPATLPKTLKSWLAANTAIAETNAKLSQKGLSRIQKATLLYRTLPLLQSGHPLDKGELSKLSHHALEVRHLDVLQAATEAGADPKYIGRYIATVGKPQVQPDPSVDKK